MDMNMKHWMMALVIALAGTAVATAQEGESTMEGVPVVEELVTDEVAPDDTASTSVTATARVGSWHITAYSDDSLMTHKTIELTEEMMDEFFDELRRVTEHQMIWGGNYFGLPPNKHFIIWDKKQPFDFTSSMCEYCWSSLDKPAKMFSYNVGNELGKIHPTQKPVALYAWILKHYAKPGDRIFDPMMGSQSSRIAAYKMGFDYVGCELDKEYFDKGCERFNRECKGEHVQKDGSIIKQTSLFDL